MNKRGFTLIELLATITLMGVIIAIGVPSFNNINQRIKNNMLNTKINFITEASILYGEDNINELENSSKTYNNYKCLNIIVSSLVPVYIDSDNDNKCLNNNSDYKIGCIIDPSNKNNYLDQMKIIIYYKDNKVKAIVDQNNNLTCS